MSVTDEEYLRAQTASGLKITLIYKTQQNTLVPDYYLITATDDNTKYKMKSATTKYIANKNYDRMKIYEQSKIKIFNVILNDYFDKVKYLVEGKKYYYNAYRDNAYDDNFSHTSEGLQLPLIYLGEYDGKKFDKIIDNNSLGLDTDTNKIRDNLNKVYVAKDILVDRLKIMGGKRKSRRRVAKRKSRKSIKSRKLRKIRR